MKTALNCVAIGATVLLVAACNAEQRETVDSAAGEIAADTRVTISVLNIETGRRLGADNDIEDDTDTFAPNDTIYAKVNTTGTVRTGAITSQWTFPDGSVIDQQAQPVTGDRGDDLLFFITKPEGLAPGKYTFRVIVDGKEVRSTDVTVR